MSGVRAFIKFFAPCQENNFRPPFLESGLLVFVIGLFLVLKLINISFVFYLPKTDLFADVTKSVLLQLTNQERQKLGLQPLRANQHLEQAAYQKAQDMLQKGYFAHTSPAGTSPWYWIQNEGYRYQYAGENLAIGFLASEELFSAWYNSLAHRNNLLGPNYQEVGIAIVKGSFRGSETTLAVQFFGTPIRQTQQPKSAELPESTQIAKDERGPSAPKAEILAEKEPPQNITIQEGGAQAPLKDALGVKVLPNDIINFMAADYTRILENGLAAFMVFLIVLLGATTLLQPDFQRKDVTFRTIGIIIFLAALLALDTRLIVNLIPHRLLI